MAFKTLFYRTLNANTYEVFAYPALQLTTTMII